MSHTLRYTVDEKMNRDSISQYLYAVHLRPKLPVFVLLLLYLTVILFIDFPYRDWLAVGLGVAIVFLIIVWVKTYFAMQAQGRDGLKLLTHPEITITIDEEIVEYASSTGNRRHAWNKIDRFCETRDFLVFHSGKIPLLVLPKAPLTPDALAFIKTKTRGLPSPAARS